VAAQHVDCEHTWRDVLGILKAQGPRLDRADLDEWATSLGLGNTLARAHGEARG